MATEKIARLMAGEIEFYPLNTQGEYEEKIVLGFNQSVSISRSAEKKELFSNDFSLGENVAELETKVTYEFSTEIADLNAKTLALIFKGNSKQIEFVKGAEFFNGKIIKGEDGKPFSIGDTVIKNKTIYIFTADSATFKEENTAPKKYKSSFTRIAPETRANNFGKIIINGTNLNTGKPQTLLIPKINLSFDGDLSFIADDYAKVALKGKILRKGTQDLFVLFDGEEA